MLHTPKSQRPHTSVQTRASHAATLTPSLASMTLLLASSYAAMAGSPAPAPAPYPVVIDIDRDGQPGGNTNPAAIEEVRLSDPNGPLFLLAALFFGDQAVSQKVLNTPAQPASIAATLTETASDSTSADLDCDGDEDLLAISFENLSLIRQNPDGTFAAPAPCAQVSGSPFGENCVKVTDLTGDQCPDIVAVSNTFQSNNDALIQVFPNSGGGVFLPPTTITIPGATIAGNAVGDIDGDGADEVAVIRGTSTVSILRRTAPATLTPLNATTGQPLAPGDDFALSAITFPAGLFEVTLADVNKDGNADILASNLNDIFIRPSLGNGTFGPFIILDGDSGTRNIAVADFNADGTTEVFATNPNTNAVNHWRSTGPLQWGTKVDLPVGTSPSGVLATDTNDDGLLDILALNRLDGDAVTFLNTGAGDFFLPQRFSTSLATPGGYTSVASGDFNADGYADVFASTQRGELHLFPNAADGSGGLLAPITRRISFNPFVVAAVPAPPGLAGDGRDRVAAAFIGRREIVVLKYDETRPPTNPFETIQTFFAAEITPDTVTSISTCDINSDGIADIAITVDNSGAASRVFPGLSTGLFNTAQPVTVGLGGTVWDRFIVPSPTSGLPANYFYLADFQSGNVQEMRDLGGSFGPGRLFQMGANCTDIDLAQTDADAIADLVAVQTGATEGTVTVQRGLTAPGVPSATSFSIPRNPAGLTVGDLNADGRDDLLISTAGPVNQNQYVISILNSSIGLRPETATLHPAGERPARPILADLHNPVPSRGGTTPPRAGPEAIIPNRDATGFSFNASVMVLPNQIEAAPPPLACRADFNTDGVVSTPDLVFFLGRFGEPATPGSPAQRADFNNDGIVNTPDLVFFLGRFAETCPR